MDREEFEEQVREFMNSSPTESEMLKLAFTLVHQAFVVLEGFPDEIRSGVEDAEQDLLDTADDLNVDLWE